MKTKEQILEIFRKSMPRTFRWHEGEIGEIIDYLMECEADYSLWSSLSYAETTRMKFCSQIADHIKYDVIEKGNTSYMDMHLQKREPENEYEKGVFSCLGVIYHLQHCMNPG